MEIVGLAVQGVTLSARSRPGAGRPVLLVHGLSSNARLWDGVAAALAGRPVVAVDLRGHGGSADVRDAGSDPTLQAARDLAAVCEQLGAAGYGGVTVAGQSWGGNVVLQLAADRPDLVHGLALVDGGWLHLADRFADADAAWEVLAPPRFDGLTLAGLRARLVAMHPDWSPSAVDATLANLHPEDPVRPWLTRERHRAIVASMVAHRPRELYPRVSCHVLLLAAVPGAGGRELVDEAAAALPSAELVEFPGADHDLHAQHPERVAALIGGLG